MDNNEGRMMGFFKKITGIEKREKEAIAARDKAIEEATAAAETAKRALNEAEEARKAMEIAKEEERIARMSPKERATAKNMPWVDVLETHVNEENIRNGFFELDWNQLFVDRLIKEGYGFEADKEEEIVDRWFRELCANVVVDGDYGGALNAAGSVMKKLEE